MRCLSCQVVDPEGSQAEETQRVARHQEREHRGVSVHFPCNTLTDKQCLLKLANSPPVSCAFTVNIRWWTTTKTFLITTSGPGNWATSTGYRPRPSSRARETEHSWFETAAKQDATPAALCTYQPGKKISVFISVSVQQVQLKRCASKTENVSFDSCSGCFCCVQLTKQSLTFVLLLFAVWTAK